jgi:hypothetical protein
MPGQQGPSENIVAKVHRLVFGEPGDYRENPLFLKELRSYKKIADRNGRATVTLPAIAGWFRPQASEPRRVEALQFLRGYVLWTIGRPQAGKIRKRQELEDFADQLRHTIEFELSTAQRGGNLATNQPRSKNRTARSWVQDQKAFEKLTPIAGAYQIIRPYTSKSDRYVLEALSINIYADGPNEAMVMYSHTQPKREYLYAGSISINNKYCFGSLSRQHEDFESLRTPRSVVMYISEPEACVSGIMLRGVSGNTTIRTAIAVPFIAIRSPYDMNILRTANVTKLRRDLYQLERGLIVGEISNTERNAAFQFCDAIFEKMKPLIHNINGFVLQTIEPKTLCDLVAPEAKSDNAYFLRWQKSVEPYLQSIAEDSQVGPGADS